MVDQGMVGVVVCLLIGMVCAPLAFLFLVVPSVGVVLRVVRSWLILAHVFLGLIPCCRCFGCDHPGIAHAVCGDLGVVFLVVCHVRCDFV